MCSNKAVDSTTYRYDLEWHQPLTALSRENILNHMTSCASPVYEGVILPCRGADGGERDF